MQEVFANDTRSILKFLHDFALLIDKEKVHVLTHREENKRLMMELGLRTADVLNEIKQLDETHYIKQDFDRNHHMETVWIFKKEIEDVLVYIKIQERIGMGFVISFHEDI